MGAAAVIHFDTLRFVKKLKAVGVPEQQAEAFAEVQQETLSEYLDNTAATKSDLNAVKTDLTKYIDTVKVDLTKEIHDIKSNLRVLTWMMGFLLATTAPVALKLLAALIH